MKKFFMMFAAVCMVAMTAMCFTSCSDDDKDQDNQQIWISFGESDNQLKVTSDKWGTMSGYAEAEFIGALEQCFTDEIAKISGLTKDGSYYKANGRPSSYENALKTACENGMTKAKKLYLEDYSVSGYITFTCGYNSTNNVNKVTVWTGTINY